MTQHETTATEEWTRFTADLALCLSDLDEDEFLILTDKRTRIFVQFAAQGAFGMRVEAVANVFIEDPTRLLTEEQFAQLEELGWWLPTNPATGLGANEPPDGSPNFYREVAPPVDFLSIANLAVRTLREVHGVGHPGNLEYTAFSSGNMAIRFPTLRVKRATS